MNIAKMKFGDLFEYENKSKIKAGDGFNIGKYPFYTSSSVLSKYVDEYLFDKTSLVFGTGGNASIHYCECPFSVSTDCLVAVAKDEEKCYPKYVFYYFLGNINILEDGFKGAGLKHISKGFINEIPIPLPPLPIQKRIAEILDAADALKRKDQTLLKKYDELAQAIFIDMFGDTVKNEKGWEIGILGDYISVLTDYHSNGSYETLRDHVTLKNVPDYALMVRTTDLEKNNFTDNVNYISKEAYEHLDKSKVFGGEIIINKIGSAGNLYLMPFLNRPVSLGMNAFLVRLNESLNPVFAFHFLNTDYGKYEISKRVFGAVTKTITKDAVRSIPMFKIPKKQQELYVECITKINSLINCGNALQSDLLFNSLIQKAFNGELVAE